uniref:Uncharacterized protein n=1 Tax=Rhizophora mucronata TaxID=61149 RepID=A0A2P2Q5L1_RHIMU
MNIKSKCLFCEPVLLLLLSNVNNFEYYTSALDCFRSLHVVDIADY